MSKYKYTSQLSSQYRKVFRSYHSLDHYKHQSKHIGSNTSKQLSSYIRKQQILLRNSTTPTFVSKPEVFLYYKNTNRQKQLNSQLNQKREHLKKLDQTQFDYRQKIRTEPCEQKNNYKYQSLYNGSQNYRDKKQPYFHEFQSSRHNLQNTKQQQSSYNHLYDKKVNTNIQLKTKLNEINKKRNQIKLKVRMQDISNINKKYSYLDNYQINVNERKDHVMQKPANKQNYVNFNQIQKYSKQRLHTKENYQLDFKSIQNKNGRKPMQQMNRSDFIHKNNFNINQINSRQINKSHNFNFNNKSSEGTIHEQNFIKTPHFNETIQVTKQESKNDCIKQRLQRYVKNTFTDRF